MEWVRYSVILFMVFVGAIMPALSEETSVVGQVIVENGELKRPANNNGGVVIWLEPMQSVAKPSVRTERHFTLTQKRHTFEPHLLVVPVGATVQFPNQDAIFHNVFSMFRGKRFDLGLYEAGNSKEVRFDKPGVSYIFCNIHPQMGAVVVALSAPYYGVSDRDGSIRIDHVPSGSYRLNLWVEGASRETLDALARVITVPSDTNLSVMHIPVTPSVNLTHTNKFGHPYDPEIHSYPQPTS
jgi:plastocyanin